VPKCTFPYVPKFRAWFNEKFGDLCDLHDTQYRTGYPRKQADIELSASILLRGYPVLAFFTYIFVRTFGFFHYAS